MLRANGMCAKINVRQNENRQVFIFLFTHIDFFVSVVSCQIGNILSFVPKLVHEKLLKCLHVLKLLQAKYKKNGICYYAPKFIPIR